MRDEPVPVGRLLGATFRTWWRALPWLALATCWIGFVAFFYLGILGMGWTAVAAILSTEATVGTLFGGVLLSAASRQSGLRFLDGLKAIPRAAVGLAVAYAPLIAIALGLQYLLTIPSFAGPAVWPLLVIGVPVGGMLLAIDLHARFLLIVPLAVEKRGGPLVSNRMTGPYRGALHGVLLVLLAIAIGAVVVAMIAGAIVHPHLTRRVFWFEVVGAWLFVSTIRHAMAAAVYVELGDPNRTADLRRVFD